jgi:Flp pilus assembly protein TadG
MRRFTDLLQRFRRDESGAFLVIFAIIAIVLIATSGAVVDFTYTQTARSRAQNALDAAALALQSHISDNDAEATITQEAQQMLDERLADAAITAQVNHVTIDTTAGKLNLQAQITVPTAFVQLIGIRSITAQLTSEATRGSKDVEVSAALDVTGSMLGSKISDLVDATNTLIDLVVQDSQTPTYSKMAIVPWAFGANAGSYAASVRGTPTDGTPISSATWMSGSSRTISGITKDRPAVVTTSTNNGFAAGDYVYIDGVGGMTNVNGNIYKVGDISNGNKSFKLLNTDGTNVDSRYWSSFSSYGYGVDPKVAKCLNSSCQVLITTTAAHGHAVNDTVYISGASGMTRLNGTHATAVASVPTTTSYYLSDEDAESIGFDSTYSANSGKSYCTLYGCTYYYFRNASNGWNTYKVNNCTSERTNGDAYTDTAPSTSLLGFQYTSGGSDCLSQTIQPLTSDKDTLHALANSLTASGSTAGHLGLAWGWYMISPNWAYLWPAASRPAAYGRSNLIKAVILMTDGEFNSAYCNGVIAKDSGSGSGSGSSHINCNATNGNSQSQAEDLCDAIKAPANNTVLYTVGFDLGNNNNALTFLQDCASTPDDFYQADTGSALEDAFRQIAQKLNELRLSK